MLALTYHKYEQIRFYDTYDTLLHSMTHLLYLIIGIFTKNFGIVTQMHFHNKIWIYSHV